MYEVFFFFLYLSFDIYFFYLFTFLIYYLCLVKDKITTFFSRFHVNAQRLWYPVLLEMTQPTLLGTPANIQLTSSVLASLRGDFTQHAITRSIIRQNRLDVR